MDQAKSAAASLCGKSLGFSHIIPRFWSDQYDLKLQIIGISDGFDKIEIRGNKNEGKSFSVFYLKENKLICAAMVNAPRVLMKAQACITKQCVLSSQALDELFEHPLYFELKHRGSSRDLLTLIKLQ
jgi:3-phenylpropionate/trans-cinnamate dioxygenase ferredoxin reductase subunit